MFSGGKPGETSDFAGWSGLHQLVGLVLRLRGVHVSTEALTEAAKATHPMVEGKLPSFLCIAGTYGGIIAESILGDDNDGGEGMDGGGVERPEPTGHNDRQEEQDDQDRSGATGMGNTSIRVKRGGRNLFMDGVDLDG